MSSRSPMNALRKSVACLCAAALIWTVVISSIVPPAAATPQGSAGPVSASHTQSGTAAMDHGQSAHHDDGNAHNVAHGDPSGSPHRIVVCITTCLDLIAAKLLPKAADGTPPIEPLFLPIHWPRIALVPSRHHQIQLAYWPAGPPGGILAGGSGAERVLALNARLRN